MCGRSGVAGGIKHRAAADHQHRRLAAYPIPVDGLQDRVDETAVVLADFATGGVHHVPELGESVMLIEVVLQLFEKAWVFPGHPVIGDHDQSTVTRVLVLPDDGIPENRVLRRQSTTSEHQPMSP